MEKSAEHLSDKFLKGFCKPLFAEPLRVVPQLMGTEAVRDIIEALDGIHQTDGGLFFKKQAGLALHDRFQRAAALKRDHRTTRGLGLDDRNTKILFRRADKASGVRQKLGHHFIRLIAQKFNMGCRSSLQPFLLRTFPDDFERQG